MLARYASDFELLYGGGSTEESFEALSELPSCVRRCKRSEVEFDQPMPLAHEPPPRAEVVPQSPCGART